MGVLRVRNNGVWEDVVGGGAALPDGTEGQVLTWSNGAWTAAAPAPVTGFLPLAGGTLTGPAQVQVAVGASSFVLRPSGGEAAVDLINGGNQLNIMVAGWADPVATLHPYTATFSGTLVDSGGPVVHVAEFDMLHAEVAELRAAFEDVRQRLADLG